jgi:hypothetical protein
MLQQRLGRAFGSWREAAQRAAHNREVLARAGARLHNRCGRGRAGERAGARPVPGSSSCTGCRCQANKVAGGGMLAGSLHRTPPHPLPPGPSSFHLHVLSGHICPPPPSPTLYCRCSPDFGHICPPFPPTPPPPLMLQVPVLRFPGLAGLGPGALRPARQGPHGGCLGAQRSGGGGALAGALLLSVVLRWLQHGTSLCSESSLHPCPRVALFFPPSPRLQALQRLVQRTLYSALAGWRAAVQQRQRQTSAAAAAMSHWTQGSRAKAFGRWKELLFVSVWARGRAGGRVGGWVGGDTSFMLA